jgi:hypothetical protein
MFNLINNTSSGIELRTHNKMTITQEEMIQASKGHIAAEDKLQTEIFAH